MYNYMVVTVEKKKLHRDFLTYYKCNSQDELYAVSISDPELLKYLEEFIERRKNQGPVRLIMIFLFKEIKLFFKNPKVYMGIAEYNYMESHGKINEVKKGVNL